jgi:UDP-N-acetylglucosamine 2-epimerase (hydrolysing)
VVIYPNNDLGSEYIISAFQKLKENPRFRVFPSLRFEYFLILLKNSQFIIGNSSAGIREAPYYGIPVINIGTRQQNRAIHTNISNVNYELASIKKALKNQKKYPIQTEKLEFGSGNSSQLFLESMQNSGIWEVNHQKQFRDI